MKIPNHDINSCKEALAITDQSKDFNVAGKILHPDYCMMNDLTFEKLI
jgi:hypothetical protein